MLKYHEATQTRSVNTVVFTRNFTRTSRKKKETEKRREGCVSWTLVYDDDDLYHYIGERLKLEGQMKKMGV